MKSDLAATLADVEGWLDLETAWVLHELTRLCPASTSNITVIEIGCWKGRSTLALALGLKARGGGTVYAIDPHTGSEQTVWECGPMDTYDAFVQNIQRSGLAQFVTPVRTTSHVARRRFHEDRAHLLLVDASRDENAVLEYIDDWAPVLTNEAVIGFRDPLDLYHVLRRRVLRYRGPFRNPLLVDDSHGALLLLDVLRRQPWKIRDSVRLFFFAVRHRIAALRQSDAFEDDIPGWIDSMLSVVDRAAGGAVVAGGGSWVRRIQLPSPPAHARIE